MLASFSPAAQRLISTSAKAVGVDTSRPVKGDIRVGSPAYGQELFRIYHEDTTAIRPTRWKRAHRNAVSENTAQLIELMRFNTALLQEDASTHPKVRVVSATELRRVSIWDAEAKRRVEKDEVVEFTPLELRLRAKAEAKGARAAVWAEEKRAWREDPGEMKIVQCVVSLGAGGDCRAKVLALKALIASQSRALLRSKTQRAETVLSGIHIANRLVDGKWIKEVHAHVGFLVEADFDEADKKSLRAFLKARLPRGGRLRFWGDVLTREHVTNWVSYVSGYPIQCYRGHREHMALEHAVGEGFGGLDEVVEALHTEPGEDGSRSLISTISTWGTLSGRRESAQARWDAGVHILDDCSWLDACVASAPPFNEEEVAVEVYPASKRKFGSDEVSLDECLPPDKFDEWAPPPPPPEKVLSWSRVPCKPLGRDTWRVTTKDPEANDLRGLLQRWKDDHWHGDRAREALDDLNEIEGLGGGKERLERMFSTARDGMQRMLAGALEAGETALLLRLAKAATQPMQLALPAPNYGAEACAAARLALEKTIRTNRRKVIAFYLVNPDRGRGVIITPPASGRFPMPNLLSFASTYTQRVAEIRAGIRRARAEVKVLEKKASARLRRAKPATVSVVGCLGAPLTIGFGESPTWRTLK